MTKGLVMIFTGNGKGKTTSSLGLAMRAAGHCQKVCFIQFIKGSWRYGEMEAMERFTDTIDFHVMGRGFTWKSDDLDKDKAVAMEAWDLARQALTSDYYDLVVLDEFTYTLNYQMIDMQSVLQTLAERPESLHVAITGRYAPEQLLEAADLVTEMREIKHPFTAGIMAQKGVEF